MPPVPKPQRERTSHFIKAWRKFRNLTQEQVAERMGIDASTFGRVERGKVPYDQDFLELAAVALRCDPWDLLHRDPSKEGNVIDMMRALDEKRRAEAEQFIRFLASQKNH